nr:MAG TPA: hypothetical protein [Caudoviricetes sp.]
MRDSLDTRGLHPLDYIIIVWSILRTSIAKIALAMYSTRLLSDTTQITYQIPFR